MQTGLRQRIRTGVLCALAFLLAAPAFAQSDAASKLAEGAEKITAAPGANVPSPAEANDATLLEWILSHSGPAIGDRRAGELRVAYTFTAAEGWWENAADNKLAWHDAPAGQVHLRIFVLGADLRLLPNLAVHARLTDELGNTRTLPVDIGWYPLLNAYGTNLELAPGHSYALRVTVEADAANGNGLPIVADFSPLPLTAEMLAAMPLASSISFAEEAELLRPGNAAQTAAITSLWQQTDSGAEEAAGDYFVGYAMGEATVIHARRDADLHRTGLRALGRVGATALAVFPRDARTGRVVPGLTVHAELLSGEGKSFGDAILSTEHTRWFDLYQRQANVPRKAVYKLRVRFAPPGFRRWGRQGERFAAPVDVELHNVILK
ncbi:MAG: hypothetical protein P4M01_04675 [Acidobacteriota bacterium]|nr:hypothetical protein [Acidobacteriota bacterium]